MNTTADKLNKLISTKAGIKAAIEAKGVQDVGERFSDYPDKILQIPLPEYEVVNLTLTTNQATHEELIGKVVHVKYATENEQYTWEGETLTIKIPKYVAYTVELPEVEDYRKPSNFGYTAVGGNTRNITVSYDTELLTVTMSCEVASVDLTGQQVTIDGVVYQTPSDRTIVVKIPFGKTYDIVASARVGFDTPKKLSFTASQAVRNVPVVYKKVSLGVFILGTDGILYSASEWNQPNSSAVGVAVLTNECKFVIAPIKNEITLVWSKNGAYHSVSGVTTTDNSSVAKTDYKGVSNSSAIVSKYGAGTNYAAGWCQNFSFKNGKKGYLGSCGEWQKVSNNKDEIDACMSLIGGTGVADGYYWTSTQINDRGAWTMCWQSNIVSGGSKKSAYYMCAFAVL
jgi:hypothetical protein